MLKYVEKDTVFLLMVAWKRKTLMFPTGSHKENHKCQKYTTMPFTIYVEKRFTWNIQYHKTERIVPDHSFAHCACVFAKTLHASAPIYVSILYVRIIHLVKLQNKQFCVHFGVGVNGYIFRRFSVWNQHFRCRTSVHRHWLDGITCRPDERPTSFFKVIGKHNEYNQTV